MSDRIGVASQPIASARRSVEPRRLTLHRGKGSDWPCTPGTPPRAAATVQTTHREVRQ
jgi:hypothetical protein